MVIKMLGFSVDTMAEALGTGYWILVYGVGVLAMLFSTVAFQFKHRVTIILSNFLGQTCWVVYFLLQGDLTSAIACALSAVMLAVFSRKEQWKWATAPATVVFFLVVMTGFSLSSFRSWQDIFPVIAGVFAVLANCQASEKRLRQLAIPWCFFWLCNSIVKFYPIALITDFCGTLSAAIALFRYRETARRE